MMSVTFPDVKLRKIRKLRTSQQQVWLNRESLVSHILRIDLNEEMMIILYKVVLKLIFLNLDSVDNRYF